jgi:hypothetical protein
MVALYAALPGLVAGLGGLLAGRLGLETLEIVIERPGWRALVVRRLDVVRGSVSVQARDAVLHYRLSDLIGRRLERLAVAEMVVRVAERRADQDPMAPAALPLTDTMQWPGLAPEAIFGALPLGYLDIRDLTLLVPALAFEGRGSLTFDPQQFELALDGIAPAAASGLVARARLTRDGLVNIRVTQRESERSQASLPRAANPQEAGALQEAGAPQEAPLLDVQSQFEVGTLAITAALRLSGFSLDLASALLGIPPGAGTVEGSLVTRLPWPLPRILDWRTLEVTGALATTWRPVAGDYQLGPLAGHWRLTQGRVAGTLSGVLVGQGQAYALSVQSSGIDLAGPGPVGALDLRLATGSARVLDLQGRFAGEWLTLNAELLLADATWRRFAPLAGLPVGHGDWSASVATRLSWPLPRRIDPLALTVEGRLQGRWRSESADLAAPPATAPAEDGGYGLDLRAATFRLADGALTTALDGRVSHDGLAMPLTASIRVADLRARPVVLSGVLNSGPVRGAPLMLRYDPASGAGTLRLAADLDLQQPLAAAVLAGWAAPFDLDGGRLSLLTVLDWSSLDHVRGRVDATLAEGRAHYADFEATGVSGEARLVLDGGLWSLPPVTLRARTLSAGVDLTDVVTRIGWSAGALNVERFRAQLFGGWLAIDPFRFDPAADRTTFDVRLSALDLGQVLALYGDQIAGSGTLDGHLPVLLDANGVSVVAGTLVARSPGGAIRLSPALARGTGQPGLDFALRALGNFSYTELDARADYAPSGDLQLAVALRGRNPEVEQGRPIHYNLTVTENIPQLLASLAVQERLTRGIEERFTN